MKTKLKLTLLPLSLTLACALALSACDNGSQTKTIDTTEALTSSITEAQNGDIGGSGNEQQSSVNNNAGNSAVISIASAETWKSAFDLSRFDSFELKLSEMNKEGGSVFEHKGTVSYGGGMLRTEFSDINNGSEMTSKETYIKESPKDIGGLYSDWLYLLKYELEKTEDLGYSSFKYSATLGAYSAELKLNGANTKVSVLLQNGNIIRITGEWKTKLYGVESEYLYTYQFTGLDTLDAVSLPMNEAYATANKARADVKTATGCQCIGGLEGDSSDDLLYVMKDFVMKMKVGEVTHLAFHNDGYSHMRYECAPTTLNFLSGSITYSSVAMFFEDGKLYNVTLDTYLFYMKYDNNDGGEDIFTESTEGTEAKPSETEPPETYPPETEKEEEKTFFYEIQSGGMSPTLRVGDTGVFERVNPTELKVGDVILFEIVDSHGHIGNAVRRITEVYEYATHFEFQAKYDAGYEPYYIDVHQDQILGRYTGPKF